MIDVQRQKADALAAQIEQFVVATQSQISWSTAGVPAEQQRIEWLRLMRNAPAITELTHVGADGKESLFVSRLATDNVGRGHRLRERRALRPVYFRKPAEPDVSMAVARRLGSHAGGGQRQEGMGRWSLRRWYSASRRSFSRVQRVAA